MDTRVFNAGNATMPERLDNYLFKPHQLTPGQYKSNDKRLTLLPGETVLVYFKHNETGLSNSTQIKVEIADKIEKKVDFILKGKPFNLEKFMQDKIEYSDIQLAISTEPYKFIAEVIPEEPK